MAIYIKSGADLPAHAVGKLVISMDYVADKPAEGHYVMARKVIITKPYIEYDEAVKLAKKIRAQNPSLDLSANWTLENVCIF